MKPHLALSTLLALSGVGALFSAGCEDGPSESIRRVHRDHLPALRGRIRSDLDAHRRGIVEAAERLAPGFAVEDEEVQERQMRAALRSLQQPPRGVVPFETSPMSFLAAIGTDGVVIARDADPDHMAGDDFGARYPLVQRALEEGEVGREILEFPALEEGDPPSASLVFVAPSRRDGEIVGAVALGIPLWRWAKFLNHQMRLELHEEYQRGSVVWVYFYRGGRHFSSPRTPPDLDEIVPGPEERAEGLERSPGGYTGEKVVLTRPFAYGVMPTPTLGEDVGMIVFRGDP